MNPQGAVHAPGGAQAKRFGPYAIQEEIARGGQAAVMRAQHEPSGKPVAVKMLLEPTPTKVKRFRQEARVLAALNHPNLPRVTDLGELNGLTYMAMELVEGEDLDAIVRTRGVPDIRWTAEVLGTVAHTVEHCHGLGLIHRDLKPANVLIERETGRPVLLDFGLVKRDPEKLGLESIDAGGPLSQTGELRGTPSYMAPEQASTRFGAVGPWTDVYGLGATLYFLLTGAPPFGGEVLVSLLKRVVEEPPPDPRRRNRAVPAALGQLCAQAMSKQPGDRPGTAAELARVLVSAAGIGSLSLSATLDDAQVRRRLAEETAELGVPLRPGDPTQLGPYRLESLLGRGGMGSVFRARHQALDVVRAVKVLPTLGVGGPKRVQRFQREIEHLARVRDPNVIGIHDAGQDAAWTWYAMDLVDGRALNEVSQEGPLPFARALELSLGIARGVAALHEVGIVHRDLKPHNVVLEADGNPVVIDLGLAVAPELDERLTKTGAVVGTPRYMAPEQLRGHPPSPRADVYALGLILFELTTGRSPHGEGSAPHEMLAKILNVRPPPPRSIVPALPRGLDAVCARLLALAPEERPADAGAVARELEGLRGGRRDRLSPRRALAAAALLGVAVTGGLLGGSAGGDGTALSPVAATRTSSAPQPTRALSAEEVTEGAGRIAKLERIRAARARAGAAREWLGRFPGHPRAAEVETIWREARREFPARRFGDASEGVFLDASRVLTWSRPLGTIRLWDIARERELYRWRFPVVLSALAVAPDRESFLVGERGRQIRWIKLSTRETIARWPQGLEAIDAFAFSPTENLLALAGRGKLSQAFLRRLPNSARGRPSYPVVRLIDLASGKSVLELGPHWGESVKDVAFAGDGSRLVTAGGTSMIGRGLGQRRDPDNAVRVFELPSGRLIRRSRLTSRANFAHFAPGGKTFVVGGNSGQLFLYDLRGERVRAFTRPEAKQGGVGGVFVTAHLLAARGAAFSADGNKVHVALGEVDTARGGLAVWDVPSGKRVRLLGGLPALWGLRRSPDGRRLLTGSKRGVELWWAR